MLLKAFMPKIIVHVDFLIEIKVNPEFYEMFENTGMESEKIGRANKKWLVGSRSSELFTPPAFLTDFIEFSGIRPEEDFSSLLEKYQEKGLSLRQIASKKVHSRSAISEQLKGAGVKIRAPGRAHGNPSQLKFGYRKEIGKVVVHKGEQQIIGAIQDFRSEGLTFRQIAQRMTALRIPSKNGKVKWHPMMVKRIIDSAKE
jgi:hypothetical protein